MVSAIFDHSICSVHHIDIGTWVGRDEDDEGFDAAGTLAVLDECSTVFAAAALGNVAVATGLDVYCDGSGLVCAAHEVLMSKLELQSRGSYRARALQAATHLHSTDAENIGPMRCTHAYELRPAL